MLGMEDVIVCQDQLLKPNTFLIGPSKIAAFGENSARFTLRAISHDSCFSLENVHIHTYT